MSSIDHVKTKISEKYSILLKLLNKILVNINKAVITDVIQFKNIKRDELILEENEKIWDEMKDEIFKYFNKYSLKSGQKSHIKYYLLTILKSMCDELFFNFKSKSVKEKVGNKHLTYAVYNITLQQIE